MKRIRNFQSFLTERMVLASEILQDPNIGLVHHKGGRSIPETSLTLYDFKNKKAIGYAEAMEKFEEPPEVSRTAAEKGYGPSMYDFLLMAFHPRGLMPDRDSVSEAAINIWSYYSDKRSDVKKVRVKKGEPGYISKYSKHEDNSEHSDPRTLKILNTAYHLAPSVEYENLIKKGNELMKKHNKKSYAIHSAGSKMFTKKYYSK